MKRSILMWLFDLTNTGHEKPVEVSVDSHRTRDENADSDGAKIKTKTFIDELQFGSRNMSLGLPLDVALAQIELRSSECIRYRSKAVDEGCFMILHGYLSQSELVIVVFILSKLYSNL